MPSNWVKVGLVSCGVLLSQGGIFFMLGDEMIEPYYMGVVEQRGYTIKCNYLSGFLAQ